MWTYRNSYLGSKTMSRSTDFQVRMPTELPAIWQRRITEKAACNPDFECTSTDPCRRSIWVLSPSLRRVWCSSLGCHVNTQNVTFLDVEESQTWCLHNMLYLYCPSFKTDLRFGLGYAESGIDKSLEYRFGSIRQNSGFNRWKSVKLVVLFSNRFPINR